MDKSTIQFRGVHTGGSADVSNNKIEVAFNAMLAPVPDIGNNEERFVIAGLEYGTYVWIGLAKLTSLVETTVSNDLIEFRHLVNTNNSYL